MYSCTRKCDNGKGNQTPDLSIQSSIPYTDGFNVLRLLSIRETVFSLSQLFCKLSIFSCIGYHYKLAAIVSSQERS